MGLARYGVIWVRTWLSLNSLWPWSCSWVRGYLVKASIACFMSRLDSSQIIWLRSASERRIPVTRKDTQAVALEEEVSRRIESLPGVQSVGVTRYLPLSGFGPFIDFIIKGRPYHGEHNEATRRQVSARYLTTLQAQLLRGRYFTASDDASKAHVAIINQAMAKKYFPNEDPIGKQIVYSGSWSQAPPPIEIVGVVGDVKEGSLGCGKLSGDLPPFQTGYRLTGFQS